MVGVEGGGGQTEGRGQEMWGEGVSMGVSRGGLVILKATREASCTGESFGSKNVSHPHTSLCCDTSKSSCIKEQAGLQPGFHFGGQSRVCHDEL